MSRRKVQQMKRYADFLQAVADDPSNSQTSRDRARKVREDVLRKAMILALGGDLPESASQETIV